MSSSEIFSFLAGCIVIDKKTHVVTKGEAHPRRCCRTRTQSSYIHQHGLLKLVRTASPVKLSRTRRRRQNEVAAAFMSSESSLSLSIPGGESEEPSPWSFLGRRRVLIIHAHDTCRILIGSGLKMVRTGRANKDAGAVEPKLRSVRPVRPRFCSASLDALSSASSDNIFARPVRICFARPVRTKIRTGRAELFVRPIRPVRAFLVCCVSRWSEPRIQMSVGLGEDIKAVPGREAAAGTVP